MLNRRELIRQMSALLPTMTLDSPAYGQKLEDRLSVRPSQTHFHTDSTRILIPFTAVDKDDHLIDGISAHDLRLLADGKEQRVNFLSVEDGPASVLFVLDVSGSMKRPVADVQQALRRILRAANADDEFAVIEFSDKPQLTVDFTAMQSRVEERVKEMAAAGHTSLMDAIVLGLREVSRAHNARKALIVVSDGRDNHSRYVESDALRIAVESDVRVYGIELNPPMGEAFSPRTFLERISRASGGRYLPVLERRDIPGTIERIDVHRGYVLGFTPPAEHRDGKTHQIDLKLRRRPVSGRIRLFWKEHYRVPTAL